jgi:hypothetical protein
MSTAKHDKAVDRFMQTVLRWEFLVTFPLYLLCFFLPTGFPKLNFMGVIGLFVFIIVAIFRVRLNGYFLRKSPIDLPISLFVITAVGATWFSDFSPAAVARLWVILGCIAVYYFILDHSGEAQLRAMITGLVIAGVAVVLAFVLVTLLSPESEPYVLQDKRVFPIVETGVIDLDAIQSEPVFWTVKWESVAVTSMLTLPLLWSLIRLGHHQFLRITFILIAVLLILALVHPSGFGPAIALVVSLLFVGLMLKRYYLVLGGSVVGASALLFSQFRSWVVITLIRNINVRLDLWQTTYYMIRDFPLTGVGLSLSKWYRLLHGYALPNLIAYMDEPGEFMLRNSLNFFWQTWVEQGVVGFVSILAILMFGLWKGSKALRSSFGYRKSVLTGALWLLALICVHSMWYALPASIGAIYMWCALGLIMAVSRSHEPPTAPATSSPTIRWRYVFAILLGMALWLTLFSVMQIGNQPLLGILLAVGGGMALGGYAIVRDLKLVTDKS